jgi:3-hydroxyisobutyrate dehydrogenase-like beta-hydroxyacid dehydrogenase
MTQIGFIGLGRMGTPMATNVVAAGFDLTVWNRSAAKAEAFAADTGAGVAATARALAEACEIVVTMVSDGPALEAVFAGEDGLLAGLRDGGIIVDTSTVGPGSIAELAPQATDHGGHLVDAPVSGGPGFAAERQIMIMAGGADEAVRRVKPVLDAMSDKVMLVGDSGTGATMKIAINSMVYAINEAVCEALILTERSGIDRTAALDAFEASAASSPMLNFRRPVYEFPDDAPVGFTVDLAAKDLRLALELAAAVGATMPGAETNLDVMQRTSDAGMGTWDMGRTATYLRGWTPEK